MATPPFSINEAIPGDSDLISQHPAGARTFRDVVEDYLNTDHDFNTGHHANVGLVEQSGNPAAVANTGFFFTKDVAGITEVFYMDSAGTVKQITSAGTILLSALDIAINSVDGTKLALGGDTIGDIMAYDGTNWVRIPAGTAGQALVAAGAALPVWTTPITPALLVFEDQTAAGVAHASYTTGAWTKHPLTTAVFGGGSMASSVISLPSGTYDASGFIIQPQTSATRVRLQNTTDGSTLVLGQTWGIGTPSTLSTMIPAGFSGGFTIAATKNVELQYFATFGTGAAADTTTSGVVNVFAQVKLLRIGA